MFIHFVKRRLYYGNILAARRIKYLDIEDSKKSTRHKDMLLLEEASFNLLKTDNF